MAENEVKKRYKSGRNCCVVGCSSRQGRDETKFFHVVRKQYPLQGQAWVTAIARINPDGTPWTPSPYTLICGQHFIQGKPSNIADSPDYIPTIFPTGHRREATANDVDRLERVRRNHQFPMGRLAFVFYSVLKNFSLLFIEISSSFGSSSSH